MYVQGLSKSVVKLYLVLVDPVWLIIMYRQKLVFICVVGSIHIICYPKTGVRLCCRFNSHHNYPHGSNWLHYHPHGFILL